MKNIFEKIFYGILSNINEDEDDEYVRWFKIEYRRDYENFKKIFGKVTREDAILFLEKEGHINVH